MNMISFPSMKVVTVSLLAFVLAHPAGFSAPPEITLRAMMLAPIREKELWLKNGETKVPLPLSDVQPAAPVRLPATAELLVFSGTPAEAGAAGGAKPLTVKMPPGSREVLLLAAPTADGTRMFAVPDFPAESARGSWLLINASPQRAAIQLDDGKPITLASGGHRLHRMAGSAKRGAAVRIVTKDGDRWKPAYSTYWPVEPDASAIALIVHDGRKVRVKLIDNPEWVNEPRMNAGGH